MNETIRRLKLAVSASNWRESETGIAANSSEKVTVGSTRSELRATHKLTRGLDKLASPLERHTRHRGMPMIVDHQERSLAPDGICQAIDRAITKAGDRPFTIDKPIGRLREIDATRWIHPLVVERISALRRDPLVARGDCSTRFEAK
ncbi:MAG: hypothetical protein JSW48_01805 [Betaproteobacteria bacterium]|nr:MAG: hypothetical protein JSW48_01805 [Betaproteobacteria bacterium]